MGLIHDLAIAEEKGGKKACIKVYKNAKRAEEREAAAQTHQQKIINTIMNGGK